MLELLKPIQNQYDERDASVSAEAFFQDVVWGASVVGENSALLSLLPVERAHEDTVHDRA